jgi:deoxyribonuclease-1
MSWTLKKFGCRDRDNCRKTSPGFNKIEADMHNLYPALQKINSARSSYAFSMIKGEKRHFGNCDFEIDRYKRRVEPRAKSRGNIARAMFYMQQKYGLTIFKRQGELLKQWHRQDPPDAEERRRNDAIEKIQGSRNQFIDQPGLVYKIRF